MLNMQEMAKQGQHAKTIIIDERLPDFLRSPCHLNVTYHVEHKDNFYLIHLHVVGELHVACQRCIHEFTVPYDNQTIIAVCRTDERAEELLAHYECVVASNWQIDLDDLVIDELHLYAPQFHQEINDCDSEVNQILTGKIEAY